MSAPQKKFTWEIVSLILLSAIVATFVINYIINKEISWSEYPVAISLVIFSYLSLFAFWRQRTILQMIAGFFLAAACMLALDLVTGGIDWALMPGIALLLATTVIIILMLLIIDSSKHKGVNLLAWGFIGAGLLCISIEGILSWWRKKQVILDWSIIVGLCIIPVVLMLLFVHFRLRKGRSLQKTFHV